MNDSNRRPIHEIRYGSVKVVIWRNPTTNGHMFNVTAARLYKDNDGWKESSSFGVDELLVLGRALGDAFAWIHAERAASAKSNADTN